MMDTPKEEIKSSSGSRRHDVFPSFSGADVRKSFLSHLLKELDRRAIKTFIDHGIERSRQIAPELLSAIRESSISIVIFSKSYASSTWCLNELVEIHKCSTQLGQMVIPVFYDVDPSHVRRQTGEFGIAFEVTCKDKTDGEKQKWVKALADVANMAGEDLQNWSSEAEVVEKIANDVSNKVISPSPLDSFGVGIEVHLEALISMLCLESKGARMVGIWGTSGIGKSTIGRALFNQLSGQFPLRYIETYKKSTDHDEYGMKLSWEQKLLSEILGQKDIKIECPGGVEERFKDKKVLIVLDDVDNLEFLNTLVGKTDWFGPGSRIIVITQNRRLLKAHGIDLLYEVQFPSQDLALKMFCRSAFGVNSPPDDFKELAIQVARLAGNLPLGLSVLGSSLKGMEKKEWEETLPELQNGLDIINIMKPLKVSYDRLAEKDQKMFHYIAGVFDEYSVEYINDLLGDVNIRLKTLGEKSLIRITWDNIYAVERVEMHDLLKKLGKEIDRAESKGNPGKRRFLEDAKEILDVLTDKMGTATVLGINFTTPSDITKQFISIDEKSFEGMQNLELLRIENYDIWPRSRLCLPNGLDYLPRKLKCLVWTGCPLKCLPSDFKAEYLIELRMECSELEKLWEGTPQPLVNLKTMYLPYSKYLKEIPDLSKAINLKEVDLYSCSALESFSTPLNSKYLEFLNLRECPQLKNFPMILMVSSTGGIEIEVDCLWHKNLYGLYHLECFKRSTLRHLRVKGNMLEKLWDGVQSLGGLKKMDLSYCENLTEIPDLSTATNLQELILLGCKSLVMLPSTIRNLQKLVKLDLSKCENLTEIPDLSKNTNLRKLKIYNCKSLVMLSTIGNLQQLVKLDLSYCENMKEIPDLSEATNLQKLKLSGSENLAEIPDLSKATDLEYLNLSYYQSLVMLPSTIGNLQKLVTLEMIGCTRLKVLPVDVNLSSLEILNLSGCSSLRSFPQISKGISKLNIGDTAIEEVPCSIEMLSRLTELNMHGCKMLQNISPNIFSLTSLRLVDFTHCGSGYFNFQNCFKLDADARELILQSSFKWTMVLPDGEVPTYFKHRAYGNSLTVTLPQSSLSQEFLRFNACFVVEPLADFDARMSIDLHFNGEDYRHTVVEGMRLTCETDHLVWCSFRFRPTNLPSKLDSSNVKFKFSGPERIKECGIRLLNVFPYLDDLPRSVVRTMCQGSVVTSMDFHPSHPTLLTVGCSSGEVTLWEVGSREKAFTEPFKIWNMAACSVTFQGSITKYPSISVSGVSWSPDGNLIGVAFTKHLIHIYAYQGSELRQHLEMDAHVGCVNDLAFAHPDNQLCVVTCGDDKLVKVWDLSGEKLYTLEGHEAPVYSIYLHQKENIPPPFVDMSRRKSETFTQFIVSIALDGKIKTWYYDNKGSIVDRDAPGQCSRLFACGRSKDGDSFLVEWQCRPRAEVQHAKASGIKSILTKLGAFFVKVRRGFVFTSRSRLSKCPGSNLQNFDWVGPVEWDTSEGFIKRKYMGFRKKSTGVVQFDTTRNRFLAVGEDNKVKLWDMDYANLLTTVEADGGLPSLPRLRFNKDGNLLAVTTANNGFKILANAYGLRTLRIMKTRFLKHRQR